MSLSCPRTPCVITRRCRGKGDIPVSCPPPLPLLLLLLLVLVLVGALARVCVGRAQRLSTLSAAPDTTKAVLDWYDTDTVTGVGGRGSGATQWGCEGVGANGG